MAAAAQDTEVKRLFDAGAHFAQVKSRRHPSMKPYLLGARGKSEIVDLAKTEEQLIAAKNALTALVQGGKTILFVGGKAEIAPLVKAAAERAGAPYVATRWLGGTLSNWHEIKKRIDRLASLRDQKAAGTLAKQHTKLEIVKLDREAKKLETRLDGITGLEKRPDALLVIDTAHEKHAVKEAKDIGLPIIALMSSDCDLSDATFPVVANDSSRASVKLILGELADSIVKGKQVA